MDCGNSTAHGDRNVGSLAKICQRNRGAGQKLVDQAKGLANGGAAYDRGNVESESRADAGAHMFDGVELTTKLIFGLGRVGNPHQKASSGSIFNHGRKEVTVLACGKTLGTHRVKSSHGRGC
jgi:hypothetical protein